MVHIYALILEICFLDLNHANAASITELGGNAPIATEEDSLNSSSTAGEEEHSNHGTENTSSSTPQLDESIRSGTPQAKLTITSPYNLRLHQELDDAFSSLDEELNQQAQNTF